MKREGGKLYHDTRLAHPNLNPSFFNLGVSRSMYARFASLSVLFAFVLFLFVAVVLA